MFVRAEFRLGDEINRVKVLANRGNVEFNEMQNSADIVEDIFAEVRKLLARLFVPVKLQLIRPSGGNDHVIVDDPDLRDLSHVFEREIAENNLCVPSIRVNISD